MKIEIQDIVQKLGLKRLWENDFIREDYCSDLLFQSDTRVRPLFNWAYYLIPKGCIFPLHKLLSDESWQFCLGGAVDLYLIVNGEIEKIRIGPDIQSEETLFYVVKKGTWFAATPAPRSKFTLVTHCVSPGWAPEDDIAGYYEEMIKLAPKHTEFVKKFSWPKNRKSYVMHEDYKTNQSDI